MGDTLILKCQCLVVHIILNISVSCGTYFSENVSIFWYTLILKCLCLVVHISFYIWQCFLVLMFGAYNFVGYVWFSTLYEVYLIKATTIAILSQFTSLTIILRTSVMFIYFCNLYNYIYICLKICPYE